MVKLVPPRSRIAAVMFETAPESILEYVPRSEQKADCAAAARTRESVAMGRTQRPVTTADRPGGVHDAVGWPLSPGAAPGTQAARWTFWIPTPRLAGAVLLGLGLAMIPWVVYLHTMLPASSHAANWAWAWTGLDALEAISLVSTGLLLRRRDARASLTAMAASVLLLVDAWFDTMTALPGEDLASALAMAGGAELPLAAVCAVLAWRGFPRTR